MLTAFSLILATTIPLPSAGSAITCDTILAASPTEQGAFILGAANAATMFTSEVDKAALRANAPIDKLFARAAEVCRKDMTLPYLYAFTATLFQARHPSLSAEYFILYWTYLTHTEGVGSFLKVLQLTEERMQTDPHGVRLVIIKELFRR